MTPTTTATHEATEAAAPALPDQAGMLLGQVAGYMGVRIIAMGQSSGLVGALASDPGSTALELAERLDLDEFFVAVWCRGAFGAGVLEREAGGYALAPHLATLLLDDSSPAYVGGMFPLVQLPEMFGRFADNLGSGARMWWDDTSPEWINAVSGTGRPFYTRLVPGGLAQVPGLGDRLQAGCRVVDTACGAGIGAIRLAQAYPECTVVGVDGDPHSVERARRNIEDAGLADRVELHCSPLEEMTLPELATVVVNNISMHECRDADQVVERVRAVLEPGGWFVISDFPFPETDDGLRSVPGRIMSGIQFFEAQIDDQLLPRTAYDALLESHGFTDLGNVTLTPVHALTWGRRA